VRISIGGRVVSSEEMTEPPLLARHLGCGDGLMLAGGAVELAKEFVGLRFPAWTGHVPTFTEIFKDHPEIEIVPVKDENDMMSKQRNMILTGVYKRPYDFWKGQEPFNHPWKDGEPFDEMFYREIGVPIEKKWDSFPWRYEVGPVAYKSPYIFVHDDASRGFVIRTDRIGNPQWDQNMMVCPDREFGLPITSYAASLIYAHEIHVINSAFMWFCEFLPLPPKQRKFIHRYARPWRNCDQYKHRHNWIILD
jgi:hypothetical protein